MQTFVDLCGLAFVAAVLLATGGSHLVGLGGFARQVRQHALVPGVLVLPVAAGVTGLELATGSTALAALAGGGPRLGTAAFAVSMGAGAAFLLYLGRLLRAGHVGSCGCSAVASPLTPASFVPAAFLLATGLAGLLARSVAAASVPAPPTWSALAVGWGVTLAVLVLLLPASAPGKVLEAAS